MQFCDGLFHLLSGPRDLKEVTDHCHEQQFSGFSHHCVTRKSARSFFVRLAGLYLGRAGIEPCHSALFFWGAGLWIIHFPCLKASGLLGFETAQHRRKPCPSVERIRRKPRFLSDGSKGSQGPSPSVQKACGDELKGDPQLCKWIL